MGFFSDLGKKTTETTGKIAKETKLKIKINDNKGKISDLYEEIGKKVYEKHVRDENLNIKEELNEECQKIDDLAKEIEDARLEILKLNQKRLCSKCAAEIDINMIFCPKCGEKQPEQITKQEEAAVKLEETSIPEDKKQEAEDVKEDLKEEIKEQENKNE